MINKDKNARIGVTVPKGTYEKLKRMAKKGNSNISQISRVLIERAIYEMENENEY